MLESVLALHGCLQLLHEKKLCISIACKHVQNTMHTGCRMFNLRLPAVQNANLLRLMPMVSGCRLAIL